MGREHWMYVLGTKLSSHFQRSQSQDRHTRLNRGLLSEAPSPSHRPIPPPLHNHQLPILNIPNPHDHVLA
jgi:hypothetical protein